MALLTADLEQDDVASPPPDVQRVQARADLIASRRRTAAMFGPRSRRANTAAIRFPYEAAWATPNRLAVQRRMSS
jgi:hypothetical protein